MSKVTKPREWAGPMGSVCGDVEDDGSRTVHVRLLHAVLKAAIVVVAAFMAGGVVWLTWPWSPYSLKARVDALEQRVEAIEKEGSR